MAEEKLNEDFGVAKSDLNPTEMLWHDLKKAVHAQKPSNVAELQQFCQEEWAKIPPQRCNRLIASYHKRLITVDAAKQRWSVTK